MISRNTYIGEVIAKLKQKLPEYLESHGRKLTNSNMFQCVAPERHSHGDEKFSASASQEPDGTWLWSCHGCKESGTIYHAANIIEGLPITGSGFVNTTIELAERFNITIDYDKLGMNRKEVIASYTLGDIFREIDIYIKENGEGVANLSNGKFGRNYTKEQAETIVKWVPIGCIDPRSLEQHLIGKFGSKAVADLPFYIDTPSRKGLDSMVFNKDILTISIRTYYNRTIGYMGRVTDKALDNAKETTDRIVKYKFTKGLAGRKAEAMFLLDIAKQDIKKSKVVKIVEGSFDAISMRLAGITNVVASMGSSFNADQADAIMQFKVEEIVFILDSDKAGIKGVVKAMDVLKKYDVIVRAVPLPEGTDPDNIVTQGNLDIFDNEIDAVEYILNVDERFNERGKNPDVVYNNMIAFVASVTNSSARLRKYSTFIADKSSFHQSDALDDLNKYLERKETRSHEAINIWNTVKQAEDLGIAERVVTLRRASDDYSQLIAGTSDTIMRDTWEYYMGLVSQETSLPTILPTGHHFFDRATSFQTGTLAVVSGKPSNGKSSWLRYTALQMIESIPDLYVLYVSIDDQVDTTMVTFLSIITGMERNEVSARMRTGNFGDSPAVRSTQERIKNIFSNSLCLKGSADCPSLTSIRKTLDIVRSLIGDRPLMVVIDALNNLSDLRKDDQRIAIENTLRDLKFYAVETGSCIIVVTHMTKTSPHTIIRRPNLTDLKGTSFIEFEAKNVLLVHMDMHYNEETEMSWTREGMAYPIVEVNVAKDKEKSANEIIPFYFDPDHCTFEEPNESRIRSLRQKIRMDTSNRRGGMDESGSSGNSFM